MIDLVFWMGIILVVGVFGWITVTNVLSRIEREETPLTMSMAIKIFLVICGIICLSIGRNSFSPQNLDAGGDGSKITVTEKQYKEQETKREEQVIQKKKQEQKRTKEDESILLDDMKNFRKKMMDR
ncbi:MAG: hypothetical protein ACWGQW_01735 [bacterium]